jgi:hypothetical protein
MIFVNLDQNKDNQSFSFTCYVLTVDGQIICSFIDSRSKSYITYLQIMKDVTILNLLSYINIIWENVWNIKMLLFLFLFWKWIVEKKRK